MLNKTKHKTKLTQNMKAKHTSNATSKTSVDTRFCTHDLIKENDLNDHPCTPKIIISSRASFCICITCINSFIAYHKNDLEILTIATLFSVFKLDHRIERYRMIKFARSACIVSRKNRPDRKSVV